MDNSTPNNKETKLFISWAHDDDRPPFIPQLAYALGFYYDVWWDGHLISGDWAEQLIEQCKQCNVFIQVMSPRSVHSGKNPDGSNKENWCKKELKIAQENNAKVILIKRWNFVDKELTHLQYADFTIGFSEGFAQLTHLINGERLRPWESFDVIEKAEDVFGYLKAGWIPGIVSSELVDWILVEWVWVFLKTHLGYENHPVIIFTQPRTPQDIIHSVDFFLKQLYENQQDLRDFATIDRIKQFLEWFEPISNELLNTNSLNHVEMGEFAFKVIMESSQQIENLYVSKRDFLSMSKFSKTMSFDVASKLRSLIRLYARRAKHLY